MSYERIQDIEEKSTIYPLRIAFSFLASAALLSVAAVLTSIAWYVPKQAYVASLSAIINFVAAYHYREMIKVRTEEKLTNEAEWKMGALRHSDWTVTMPLLVIKLYAFIDNAGHDPLLGSVDAHALLATIMVVLGAYVRLGLDELAGWDDLSWYERYLGPACYFLSWAILVLLLVDLCQACSGVGHTAIVYAFFLVWPLYGVASCLAAWARKEQVYDLKAIGLTKDVVYCALDVFSKATFAWYTSSAAFNVSVLGS